MITALPTQFDKIFDEATNQTTRKGAIKVLRTSYKTPTEGSREAADIIADCVRMWTYRVSDVDGVLDVASALNIILNQEERFLSFRRISLCLNAFGVSSGVDSEKFVDRNAMKSQVTSRIFRFWSALIPETTLPGFIGRVFDEDPDRRIESFRK